MGSAKKLSVESMDFDPAVFGFDTSFNGNRKIPSDADYIKAMNKGDRSFYISLSSGTSDFAVDLIGDTCDFAINQRGQILLYPGSSRLMSKSGSNTNRRTISISSARERIKQLYGSFDKVYLKATLYAQGNALLLTPTGEVK